MLRQRQSVVSDEVQHEVEGRLNPTDAFLLRQKVNFTRRWATTFSRPSNLDLAQGAAIQFACRRRGCDPAAGYLTMKGRRRLS